MKLIARIIKGVVQMTDIIYEGEPLQYTPEEVEKILLTRLNVGDGPNSPFYPLFSDDEVALYLRNNNWNVRKATRQLAIAAFHAVLPDGVS